MPIASRTFRVFISSTFADMAQERNALHADVFPKLERLCERAGYRFQAIDLRWGVSDETGFDHQTESLCLREIGRCRSMSPKPNFVILLGHRYGWRPLPETIPEQEFKALLGATPAPLAEGRALALHWYQRDRNAKPPQFVLRPRRPGETPDIMNDAIWRDDVEVPLREFFSQCAELAGLSAPRRDRFGASLTEREIVAGAIGDTLADARSHVHAYIRELPDLAQLDEVNVEQAPLVGRFLDLFPQLDGRDRVLVDKEARQRQRSLVARVSTSLGADRVQRYRVDWTPAGPDPQWLYKFCNDVYQDLKATIETEIAKRADEERGQRERAAQRRFGQERGGTDHFFARDALLDRLLAQLDRDGAVALVGVEGVGKSAIMAATAAKLESERPQSRVIARYVGATPASANLFGLLSSIIDEMLGPVHALEGVADLGQLVQRFRKLMTHEQKRARTVYVLIDGLDQLESRPDLRPMAWLPLDIAQHVKLVVSTALEADGSGRGANGAALLEKFGLGQRFVTPVLSRKEGEEILQAWLSRSKRALTPAQTDTLLSMLVRCPRPLALRLAFEEARLCRSAESLTLPEGTGDALLEAMVEATFARLSAPVRHGELLVDRALAYLAASRHGLTEIELVGLLSADREFAEAFELSAKTRTPVSKAGEWRLPAAVWTRLLADLEPYLSYREVDGVEVFDFYHRILKRVASRRFLSAYEADRRRHVGGFFEAMEFFQEGSARDWSVPPAPRRANLRKASELPWQAAQSFSAARMMKAITDIAYLEATAESGQLYQLLSDLRMCADTLGSETTERCRLELLHIAIQRDLDFIAAAPASLFQCLWNSCWWYDAPELAGHLAHGVPPAPVGMKEMAAQWRSDKRAREGVFYWLRNVRPPFTSLGSPLRKITHTWDIEGKSWGGWSSADGASTAIYGLAWSRDGERLAVACQDSTIRIWDVVDGARNTALLGHEGPVRNVAWGADGNTLYSIGADAGALIWNVQAGAWTIALGDHNVHYHASVQPAPDTQRLAIGDGRSVRLWSLPDVEKITQLDLKAGRLAWSADGTRFVACADQGLTIVSRDGEILQKFNHKNTPACVAWSKSGALALGFNDGAVVVMSEAGEELQRWQKHKAQVNNVAWADDDEHLASASDDGSIRVWRGDREVAVLLAHSDEAEAVSWRPGTLQLASGGWDQGVYLWDLSAPDLGAELVGHPGFISEFGMSKDLSLMTTVDGVNDVLKLWDTETGLLLQETQLPEACNGSHLFSWADDNSWVRLFNDDLPIHNKGVGRGRIADPMGESMKSWLEHGQVRVGSPPVDFFRLADPRVVRLSTPTRGVWGMTYMRWYATVIRLERD